MLTSQVTKTVDIPHEPGEWAEIRMLSWRQKEEARTEKMNELMQMMETMSSDAFKSMRELSQADEEAARKDAERDVLSGFNVFSVLKHGLLKLSYEGGIDVNDFIINDLDEETKTFLARTIVEFSGRSPEEGKGSRKPSSRSSRTKAEDFLKS